MKKPFWKSRTLWVNLIAAVALFLQQQFGYVIDPMVQAMLLAALNFLLRFDTSEPLGIR